MNHFLVARYQNNSVNRLPTYPLFHTIHLPTHHQHFRRLHCHHNIRDRYSVRRQSTIPSSPSNYFRLRRLRGGNRPEFSLASSRLLHDKPMPGRGRGGGRGGGRPPPSREVIISKNLSFVLRHGAEAEGIELDEGGWANVRDVVGLCSECLCVSVERIHCF